VHRRSLPSSDCVLTRGGNYYAMWSDFYLNSRGPPVCVDQRILSTAPRGFSVWVGHMILPVSSSLVS